MTDETPALIALLAKLNTDEPVPPSQSEAEAIAEHMSMLEAMPTLDDILAASPTAAEREAEYLALLDQLDTTDTYTPHPGNPDQPGATACTHPDAQTDRDYLTALLDQLSTNDDLSPEPASPTLDELLAMLDKDDTS